MHKTFLFFSLAFIFSGCSPTSAKQPIVIEDESHGPNWVGPGLYWGIYINNEDDYWRHYDQRYPESKKNRGLDRPSTEDRG